MSDNFRQFDNIDDITPDDVQWLKDGSYRKGRYVFNPRSLHYRTKRGKVKAITCYILSSGETKWRTWTDTGNESNHLTNEEAAVFVPEIAARRAERKRKEMEKRQELDRKPVKVGDVFCCVFGYDATIYGFHEVVRVSKTGKTVWTRELRHETAPGYGCCDWKCRPHLHDFTGPEERHVLQYKQWDNGEPSIAISSWLNASLMHDTSAWHDADNYH